MFLRDGNDRRHALRGTVIDASAFIGGGEACFEEVLSVLSAPAALQKKRQKIWWPVLPSLYTCGANRVKNGNGPPRSARVKNYWQRQKNAHEYEFSGHGATT